MQVWGTFNGRRRPYSGFILATITALEPKLHHILPFILDLNNNPDDIVAALGLNFNPEEQLHLVKIDDFTRSTTVKSIENQTISKPSDNSKALPPVTPIVDSLKQPSNKLKEHASNLQNAHRISDRATAVTVTTEGDKLKEHSQSTQSAHRSLEATQRSDRRSFSQQPLPNPQTNLQKLPAGTHRPAAVTPKVEIEDTRGETVQKEISLNQSAKTESQVSNKFQSQEKPKTRTNSQRDSDNEFEKQPARVNKLAKWIDELCQGSGWDRDDMVFIRF